MFCFHNFDINYPTTPALQHTLYAICLQSLHITSCWRNDVIETAVFGRR